jgi:hypothetical protein
MMHDPAELPQAWRARAAQLREYGAEPQAVALERAAAELEAALHEHDAEELGLTQGAAESGYTPRRLAQMLAEGRIPNRGRKGAPKIRRSDLPKKPTASGGGTYDPHEDARRLLAG